MDFAVAVEETLKAYNLAGHTNMVLKEEQRHSLEIVYQSRDLIVNLPTSFGKSLIYHLLPGVLSRKLSIPTATVVVICPLNVIQLDQQKILMNHGLRTCILDYKCTNSDEVTKEDFDIIFAHPEAFFSTETGKALLRNATFQNRVKAACIDECHKSEEWSKCFRKAYAELYTLRTFFAGVPLLALSGTLTTEQMNLLPSLLSLSDPVVISRNPDRPNIYLSRQQKDISDSPTDTYERIYAPLIDALHRSPETFPVTLLYLPMERSAECVHYCRCKFGFNQRMEDVPYAPVFSKQAASVTKHVTADLKKQNPHVKLVLCTPAVGMGFDPPGVDRVVHAFPPRRLSDYFQQVGRAGRSGQRAEAILHFTSADIKSNLPGIQTAIIDYCNTESCLRSAILSHFGFSKNTSSPTGCLCCSICKKSCTCFFCVSV